MKGPEATDWGPFDAALLRAVDAFHGDASIIKITWRLWPAGHRKTTNGFSHDGSAR